MTRFPIIGAGGGRKSSAPRQPVEAPDTLQSIATARMLMLIGIGEMGGPVDGLKSIYLDGVPLENADGSRNFERVQAEWRTGTQTQSAMDGQQAVETEYSVGVEVKAGAGIVRNLDQLEAHAVRVTVSVPALFSVNPKNGDTKPTKVELVVELKPANGQWREKKRIGIFGKTRNAYQRAVRVSLDGKGPWQLRVRRLSGDSTTQNLVNATRWDSYTLIQETRLRYPNYAMLSLTFDARQFSRIPEITSDWRLAVLRVPSNYDPAAGTYSGAWDGTFKPAHSSNPAWWLYTFATDPRYNINLPAEGAWKWDLYRIAQWCDQRINNGQGGTRRRFEAHNYHADATDAWKALQDIASIFCGKVVPYAGGIRVIADIPGDVPAKHFSPANAIGGRFTYASTELAERHTVASVSFVDPQDSWHRAVEYVEHPEGLARYGYQPTEVVAVGCTSRAQAQQLGRYLLETAQTETQLISLEAGLYGCDLQPGELFTVFDPVVAGRRTGGRLLKVSGVNVELDAPVTLEAGISYSLECPMPDGKLVQRGVLVTPGETSKLKLVAAFPAQPVDGTTWALIATNLQPTLWRCIVNREQEPGRYVIEGLQHNPRKWDAIERGIRIDSPPVSALPDAGMMPPVASVALRESSILTGDGRRAVRMEIDWPALSHPYLRGYVVGYRQEDGNWLELPETPVNHAELEELQPGAWEVRVSAVSVTGLRGVPVLGRIQAQGHTAKPGKPTLAAQGGAMRIDLSWRYPAGLPDLRCAQLLYSTQADDKNPKPLAELAYPANAFAHLGVGLGVRYYYWLRVVDSWGNWSEMAQADAESIKDPSSLLEQLQNSIGGNQLAEELKKPIAQVPGILDQLNETAIQLAETSQLAGRAIETALQNVLAQDVLGELQGQQHAFAKQEIRITQDALRSEVQARQVLAATLGDTQAALVKEQQARAEGDSALAKDITSLTSRTDQAIAGVQQELQTATGPNGALAKSIGELSAKTDKTVASIQQEQKAQAEADKALAGDIKALASQTDQAVAGVRQALQTATGPNGALAKSIGELSAKTDQSVTAIQQEQKAQAEADKALAQSVQQLSAKTDSAVTGIRQEESARANADAALSQRIDTLQSTVNNKADGGTVNAVIQRVAKVETDVAGKASASEVHTLQTTVNGQTAAVQDISRSLNGVLAERTLKVTAGGKVAGIGLRADEQGAVVDILADKFAISRPDGSGSKQTFVVGNINGQSAVGIAGDLILDGTLSGRRVLASESVDAAQINSRGLTIRDGAGNVVVDMNGMGAHKIQGQLSAGQIDARGLCIRRWDGAVVVDVNGMDASYVRNLMVDTLQIRGEAVTKNDTRTITCSGWVQNFDYYFHFGCSDAGTLLIFGDTPSNGASMELYARDRKAPLGSGSAVLVLTVSAGETVQVGVRNRGSFNMWGAIRYGCVLFRR
ncbi:hypothetical protein BUE93_05800 [Chromobacterium amazonense]|uniref:Uncharacterized protein n=1 Tax=Chromobacterium amazonense TaxID=1382803 RepID=A0A2S9X708_9NEIS|nr:phage tail protein [Chromobacterium amazonense]PRP71511.1 hypothetical protein BUE93_05800 [Chromobacterium amazonense]